MRALGLSLLFGSVLVAAACSSTTREVSDDPVDGGGDSASVVTGDGQAPDSGGPVEPGPEVSCETTFRYVPPPGKTVRQVAVTGEWTSFAKPGVTLQGPDMQGAFTGKAKLAPGIVGYKLLLDGEYEIDPKAELRKYVGGVENSAVRVADCKIPTLEVVGNVAVTRPAPRKGTVTAEAMFTRGFEGQGLAPETVTAELRKGRTVTKVNAQVDARTRKVKVALGDMEDGKYTIVLRAKDKNGAETKPLRLVFWVEAEVFDWKDALIYMPMIDRFENGDKSNDPAPTPGVDPRADFKGGDLQGVKARIDDGTLDELGVRAIWLSPFHTNPNGSFPADGGVANVMGYHGYWPVKAREVDPRIGGKAALEAMVESAHAHGIRVLQDFVVNHIHKEHEYFTQHPDWFRTGCVCGTNNCDWTARRLDCLFADYLPDVNWQVPAAAEQMADDAVFWLDQFDIDGLRVDAVKHVEDVAVYNLREKIHHELEASGRRVFLTGETAMGWNDCGVACNASEYGTINRYMGPLGLDGQFDFVLYHAVPIRTFGHSDKGLIHADYWSRMSLEQYVQGSVMTPYIGSHDTSRFVTSASYRGQSAQWDRGIPGNKWFSPAGPPGDAEPFARHRLALAWLLTQPGAPLLYYGDEYGEFGGSDPNNRTMWRGKGTLSAEEQKTLTLTKALGKARQELPALRRGDYRTVLAEEDMLVFSRTTLDGKSAIVALTTNPSGRTATVTLPVTAGLASGQKLRNRLGPGEVTVAGREITVTLEGRGAAIFAP